MSASKVFLTVKLAGAGIAALTMTACASGPDSGRYADVYNYESGRNCGSACAAPAAMHPVPMPVQHAPVQHAPVYMDCSQVGGMNCGQSAPVYTQPAPVYTERTPATVFTQPSTTYTAPATTYAQSTTSYGEAVSCPAGTTAQSDGTCLQGSSYGTTTYDSGSTHSSTDWSSSTTTSSSTSMGAPVNCPAGTTAQSDGTCLQGGSGGYSGATVDIYTPSTTTSTTTTSTGYGYTTDGGYGSTDYLPIRK